MRLIPWQDIWITVSETEKLGEGKAAHVLLKAIQEIGAFDDRGVWINDRAREGRS